MNEVVSSTRRFFGGFGLACLIADLATERAGSFNGCRIRPGDVDTGPVTRSIANAYGWPASREYYQICDRIARGEEP